MPSLEQAQTWSAAQTFSAQMISSVSTGTAPFSVASTTPVSNPTVQRADSLTVATGVNPDDSGLKHARVSTGSIVAGSSHPTRELLIRNF